MNFELAAHQAVQNVFGSLVKVKGCFYHLTQATFRKIQELEGGLCPNGGGLV